MCELCPVLSGSIWWAKELSGHKERSKRRKARSIRRKAKAKRSKARRKAKRSKKARRKKGDRQTWMGGSGGKRNGI